MTTAPTTDAAAKKDLAKLQRAIVDGLEDVKAADIRVFDTTHLTPLFERVIVATGNTNRQTKALAASVRDALREAGLPKPRSEGEDNGEWIIIDCGTAVCHIMQPAIRQYYRLEEIWGDKPVRLKLGAAQPRDLTAPPEDAPKPARKAAKTAPKAAATPVAKKAPAKKAVAKPVAAKRAAVAKTPAAKTPATKTAKPGATAKPSATRQSPARKAPAKKTAPVKTVLVNAPTARKTAAKTAAKTPARKAAVKKTPSRKA